jgi:pimeloyl-ACP methyl ester carboxylesterase
MELLNSADACEMSAGWLYRSTGRPPLYAAVHLPADGQVHAVAVLCPPAGLEAITTYRAIRLLAERLAQSGMAVVRFDYAGCGDSVDGERQSSAEDWLASIEDVLSSVREAGARHVTLVGMRLGATLAAAAAARSRVDDLVLWDPCETGKAFLLEEKVLLRMGVTGALPPPPPEGFIDGPGARYTPETVAMLRQLDLRELLPCLLATTRNGGHDETTRQAATAPGVFVLYRAAYADRPVTREVLAIEGVEGAPAHQQEALFDQMRLQLPADDIDTLVQWVSRRRDCISDAATIGFRLDLHESTKMCAGPGTHTVEERLIRIGSGGLLAITSRSPGGHGPAVVLTNAAAAHRVGPARLWVELARRLAAAGATVVRFDGWAIGDSPWDGGKTPPPIFAESSVQGVLDAIDVVAPKSDNGGVTLVGLCSAAWACLVAASRGAVNNVYALNAIVWDAKPSGYGWATTDDGAKPPSAVAPRGLRTRGRAALRAVVAKCLLTATPESLWWRLGARGVIGSAPTALLTPVLNRGIPVRLLLGPKETARFRDRRGHRVLRRLRPHLTIHEETEVDHSLVGWQARTDVGDMLYREIIGTRG